jgi:hypothetical protein
VLAYVLWHRPDEERPVASYRAALLRFHEALRTAGPEGLVGSASAWVTGAWWMGVDPCFEDWYVLEGSAALDWLNEAAVGPRCLGAHDAVAEGSAVSAAGLYRHRAGALALAGANSALWFDRSAAVTTEDLVEGIGGPSAPRSLALWSRYMTLGPAPEFCVLGPTEGRAEMPGTMEGARRVTRHPLWVSGV